MVEWTKYLFFRPVRLTSSKTHPVRAGRGRKEVTLTPCGSRRWIEPFAVPILINHAKRTVCLYIFTTTFLIADCKWRPGDSASLPHPPRASQLCSECCKGGYSLTVYLENS